MVCVRVEQVDIELISFSDLDLRKNGICFEIDQTTHITVLGVPLGVVAGIHHNRWPDFVLRFVSVAGVAVAAFVPLAYSGGDLKIFAAIMAIDSFGLSFAGVALVTYMSSLTSLGYTATQYALLSSAYAYLGKILKGFSGEVVDTLSMGRNLMDAYAIFFTGAAAIGLPALILCLFLVRAQPSLKDN